MLGAVVTSQYPGNNLQREAEKNSAFWCPENPFLEMESYLAFLLHIQSFAGAAGRTRSEQVLCR